MAELAELIGASEREWVEPVETAVFGTADPEALARVIDELCRAELGSAVAAGLFYEASAGCVFGVALADGSRVAIKAYQRRWTPAFLTAVSRAQTHLADSGFPCARPLAGPVAAGDAVAVVETYLPDPGPQPVTAASLRVSAAGLFRQVAVCRDRRRPGPRRAPDGPAGRIRPVPRAAQPDLRLRGDRGGKRLDRRVRTRRSGRA